MARNISDCEKERILLKMAYEGGFKSYLNYGISTELYKIFESDFETLFITRTQTRGRNNPILKVMYKNIGEKILKYLNENYV
jgi:hypothetical protein